MKARQLIDQVVAGSNPRDLLVEIAKFQDRSVRSKYKGGKTYKVGQTVWCFDPFGKRAWQGKIEAADMPSSLVKVTKMGSSRPIVFSVDWPNFDARNEDEYERQSAAADKLGYRTVRPTGRYPFEGTPGTPE